MTLLIFVVPSLIVFHQAIMAAGYTHKMNKKHPDWEYDLLDVLNPFVPTEQKSFLERSKRPELLTSSVSLFWVGSMQESVTICLVLLLLSVVVMIFSVSIYGSHPSKIYRDLEADTK